MNEPHILVVDDNPEIREIIQILLGGEGFDVTQAANGDQALSLLGEQPFELIILDIMMPGLNGYQICRKIRETSNAPILFLSARTKDSDKTLGFSSGGDDYLAKPFSYTELVWRVKALLRRRNIYDKAEAAQPEARSAKIKYDHLEIDEEADEVLLDGKAVELTDTEFAMLLLLVKNRRQTFSAQRLYEAVWEEPYYYGANNTVMVHIRNLRRKIELDPSNPTVIKTVWGKGYRCD